MKKIKFIAILLLAPFVLSNCYFMFVQNMKPLDNEPFDLTGMRVVFLVNGSLCLSSFRSYKDAEDKDGTTKCRRYAPRGYYPYELLGAYPGSDFGMKGHDDYASNEVRRLSGDTFILEIASKSHIKGLKRIRLESLEAYANYRKSLKENIIEVRMDAMSVDAHWSVYVSYFTIGLVPGVIRYSPRMSMVYYDGTGKKIQVKSKSRVYGNRWNHIVFLWWGAFVTAFRDGNLTQAHINDMFSQLRAIRAGGSTK